MAGVGGAEQLLWSKSQAAFSHEVPEHISGTWLPIFSLVKWHSWDLRSS